MTGFARMDSQQRWGSLVWEVRSLNHRYLELSLRLPEELRMLETAVREKISQYLNRGKVECSLRFSRHPGALCDTQLNTEQAERFIQLHRQAKEMTNDSSGLRTMDLLRWPGVVEESEADLEPIKVLAVQLLEQSLAQLVDNRAREGGSLKAVVQARCHAITAIVDNMRERLPAIRDRLRERLTSRLQDIDIEVDPARLEQELVLQLQKMDVDEELDRLQTHVNEVLGVLDRDEPIGRRLDFLMQELNREANTLGSKSVAVESSGAAVDLKVLIEQMREQIQNIE
jgi:uncharacterized protein (TIGR00255 family)